MREVTVLIWFSCEMIACQASSPSVSRFCRASVLSSGSINTTARFSSTLSPAFTRSCTTFPVCSALAPMTSAPGGLLPPLPRRVPGEEARDDHGHDGDVDQDRARSQTRTSSEFVSCHLCTPLPRIKKAKSGRHPTATSASRCCCLLRSAYCLLLYGDSLRRRDHPTIQE